MCKIWKNVFGRKGTWSCAQNVSVDDSRSEVSAPRGVSGHAKRLVRVVADDSSVDGRNDQNRVVLGHADLGVDVKITNFGDFCQFSAKKWRFSEKTML
jgi:hypothetical protein